VTTLAQVRDAMSAGKGAHPAVKEQLTMVMTLALAGMIEGATLESALSELSELGDDGTAWKATY
jgi:hypothetical protein